MSSEFILTAALIFASVRYHCNLEVRVEDDVHEGPVVSSLIVDRCQHTIEVAAAEGWVRGPAIRKRATPQMRDSDSPSK